ncbi:cysteinyl-tRNA synthetase [Achromatium sp. WMS2]|nr:cysteinyl-tRNA synthetase [Achromatium sp. WMS2]
MLQIYNSLTRNKVPFHPIVPNKVRLYVCGMTVYDYCHLGHARVLVAFDVVYRYLMARGYDVTYVRNITDIDDKILAKAQELGVPFTAITERFIQAMHEDTVALGTLPPTVEPRATEHIPQIIEMIHNLIARGHAYQGPNGDVYYAVTSFADYGKLSGKNIEDLTAGVRIDIDTFKRNPLDFVLWKTAKPGEPAWEAPWGLGRPGWHIECSAMSTHCLGANFDIHGGGADLQFPHHENEIAQSEGATGQPFVNIWMHNGFVRIDEEKMSKSLGNFFTIREILKSYHAEEVRYFMLSGHYRSPLNYTETNLDNARTALNRLYTAIRGLDLAVTTNATESELAESLESEFVARFHAAMEDDFNTPVAVAVLFDVVRELNKARVEGGDKSIKLGITLRYLSSILGLLNTNPDQFLQGAVSTEIADTEINELIQQRMQARKAKNWQEADRIRNRLLEQKVILEDGPQGTTWRRL